MTGKTIRFAEENDAAEILSIYEPYIKDTAVTFEYETPSLDEFSQRIRNISSQYPYIVCISDNKIIGYAYAHRHMERAAYQWNAELSVYIEKSCLRCGTGKILYQALIDILKLQNIRNVYGCVTSPNPNSEKLHEYFGFKKSGVYHNTGFKCGAWRDVIWFEKQINDHTLNPAPFLPIQYVDKKILEGILHNTCHIHP
ncbi:MAG: GNAT family N-acetyltransferase [Eubacteriales bacterium]|nr:GNAT family N-acetyltransferase [Eubacteriales bacterium]